MHATDLMGIASQLTHLFGFFFPGIDDRLDLISVHDRLRTLFQDAVAFQSEQPQSDVDEAVELATRALAPQLDEFPALRSVSLALLPVHQRRPV